MVHAFQSNALLLPADHRARALKKPYDSPLASPHEAAIWTLVARATRHIATNTALSYAKTPFVKDCGHFASVHARH
jgi:hypothetical protein